MFDNLYVLSNNDVLAWVITTSEGLILIDTMYDRAVQENIIGTMRASCFRRSIGTESFSRDGEAARVARTAKERHGLDDHLST